MGDWAVAAAGAALDIAKDGTIAYAGIALAAVGGERNVAQVRSMRSSVNEPSAELFEEAGRRARGGGPVSRSPISAGSKEYKRHVVGVLVSERCERGASESAQEGVA